MHYLDGLPDRKLFPALFAFALLPRILIVALDPWKTLTRSEVVSVAVNFATQDVLGNPFLPFLTGPTAHVAPAYPFVLGLLVRVAGSTVGGILLGRLLASIVLAGLFASLPALAVRLGLTRMSGIFASLILSVPISTWVETSGLWEVPFTAAALGACLAVMIPLLRRGRFSWRDGMRVGPVWGLSFLVAPMLAPPFLAINLVGSIRWRSHRREFAAYFVTAVALGALVVAPYLVRVREQLGTLAFVRSNLGLELAVSNNDRARPTIDENLEPGSGMDSHPTSSARERRRMALIGEGAYYHARMREATEWIRRHPRRFLELSARRTLRFWVPDSPRWYQSAFFAVALVGAIAGLASVWRQDRFQAILLAMVPVSYSAIYSFVQADIRYSYPLLWLHVLLAMEMFVRQLRPDDQRQTSRSSTAPG